GHIQSNGFRIVRNFLASPPPYSRSRRQCFNAASLPAITKRSVPVDPDVAALCCGAGAAVVDAAVKNNACSYAGSNRGIENVSVAAAGAPFCFSKRGGIRVVVDLHGNAIRTAHLFG